VLEVQRWNARLCSLKIDATIPAFEAGQFIRIGFPQKGGVLARAYSMVNAPDEDFIEVYFNVVPDGPLSPQLYLLEPGEEVWVSDSPAGFLTLYEVPDADNLWMLASGTGIGPFLSLLKTDDIWQRFSRVLLVHGVRTQDEVTYQNLTNEISNRRQKQFIRVNSITRELVKSTLGERIPTAIRNGTLEAAAGLKLSPGDTHIMICGRPELIRDGVEALGERSFVKHRRRKPGQISVEVYK